jgi:glutathione synthase
MSSLTGASYPPALDDAPLQQDRLVQTIKDWTIANGLAVRPPPAVTNDSEGILAMTAPVTLFPSPFPKSCFDEARAIQTQYNELYARISRDEDFLSGLVQECVRPLPRPRCSCGLV